MRCRNCGEGHERDGCRKATSCLFCRLCHQVGDGECSKQQTEQKICDIQEGKRTTRRRAQRIIKQKECCLPPDHSTSVYFNCCIEESQKRKVTPWLLEKSITQQLNNKPKCLRTNGKNLFLVEVSNEREGSELKQLKTINGTEVTISENRNVNTRKGLTYVYEYDLSDFESCRMGMLQNPAIKYVVIATWITPRVANSKTLLITFAGTLPPEYINVAGKRQLSNIFRYKEKPMLCRKCQKYSHTVKQCSSENVICGNCSAVGHMKDNCSAVSLTCYHCGDEHRVRDRRCPEQKKREEILEIQTNNRVSRERAKLIYTKQRPSNMNYARALVDGVQRNGEDQRRRRKQITMQDTVTPQQENVQAQEVLSSKSLTNETAGSEEGMEKAANASPQNKKSAEVVCIAPNTGELYTIKVEIEDVKMSDGFEGTSECNP